MRRELEAQAQLVAQRLSQWQAADSHLSAFTEFLRAHGPRLGGTQEQALA